MGSKNDKQGLGIDELWRLGTKYYETYVPRSFILDDGRLIELRAVDIEEKVPKEPLFLTLRAC